MKGIISERGKGKISSVLLKAQMDLNVAKENIAEKKDAKDKEKLSAAMKDNPEIDIALFVLFVSFLISFFKIMFFSVKRTFTFLVKFIPKYFIVFCAIQNEMFLFFRYFVINV